MDIYPYTNIYQVILYLVFMVLRTVVRWQIFLIGSQC